MNFTRVLLFLICLKFSAVVFAQDSGSPCGSLSNHYGPFDYRTEQGGRLRIVEQAHFTAEVEALIRGSSSYLGDDLSYTLRTSPNHHRALIAVVRYSERMKSPKPPYVQYSVDCYFERAIRFRPDDSIVRVLHAQHLGKTGRNAEAVRELEIASSQAKENPMAQYNIGLIYFELKEYDRALAQAHQAIRQGFMRPELAELLKGVSMWREAISAPEQPPETGASAAR